MPAPNLIPLQLDLTTGNYVAKNITISYPTGTGFQYVTSGTPSLVAITPTQTTALLNLFTSSLQGLVPASGGGTTNFLRADGTWAAPGGGSGGGVSSFNTRTGAITLTSSDVNTALGYVAYNGTTNPNGYLSVAVTSAVAGSGISVSGATGAITFANTGVLSFNTRTGAITLTSSDVTTALAYTPYNATNPSGFISTLPAFTASGDVTGTFVPGIPGNIALTLPNIATAGTYGQVTVNTKGQVTSGTPTSSLTTLAAYGITNALALTGGTMTGSITMSNSSTVTGLPNPVGPTDVVNLQYLASTNGILYGNGTNVVAATAGNFPVLNQSTTGNAATATLATNLVGGAAGSLVYQTGSNTTTTRTIGSAGAILSVVSGLPSWVAQSTLIISNIAGGSAGSVPYQTGANTTALLAAGTSSQVLVSGTTPSWVSIPTALGYTPLNKAGDTMTGALNMGNNQINDLAAPVLSSDAATKGYVDSAAVGFTILNPAAAATVADLGTLGYGTVTYTPGTIDANGGYGIGATLTSATDGALIIDGYSVSLNDRILVKNQTTETQNGVYTVTTVGSGSATWALTRSTDNNDHIADQLIAGNYVLIQKGTVNASTGWVETGVDPIVIGTNNIIYTEFSSPTTYTNGTGLSLTGNVFANTGVLTVTTNTGLSTNASATGNVTITNTGVLSAAAGTNIAITGTGSGPYTGAVTISVTGTVASATSATTATNLSGTTVGSIPYQSASATTGYLADVATGSVLVSGGVGVAPAWSTTPTFVGTNISGTASSLNVGGNAATATNLSAGGSNTIVYQSAAGTTAYLANGTTGQYLAATTGGAPTWSSSITANTTTNIAAGSANQIPYQTAASTTSFFSAANYGIQIYNSSGVPSALAGAAGVLQGSASANPAWTTTPTLTGTNFSGTAASLTAGNSNNTLITTSSVNVAYPIALSPTSTTGQQSLLMDTSVTVNASSGLMSATNITLSGLTANSFLYSGTGGALTTTSAPTNGQLLIGSTGVAPVVAALTGTANEISVTNAAGSITLSTPTAFVAPGTIQDTTGMYESTTGSITAAGTTLTGATALTTSYNIITTVGSGTGVSLPVPTKGGLICTVVNEGAHALNVWPGNSSSAIDGAGNGNAVILPVNGTVTYQASSTTQWYTVDPVVVSGTNIAVSYGNGQTTIGITGTVGTATNIAGGSANQIPYQTTASTTSFFSASDYGIPIYGSTGVPTSLAGAAGVLQGSASANPVWTTTPTLTGTNFSGIPNGALTNSSVTIGSTNVALGATVTAFAGLTTLSMSGQLTNTVAIGNAPFVITSTTAVANLQSQYATNLYAGTTNQIPYQTTANTTAFFSAANYGVLIYGSTGVPSALAGAAGVLQGSASANPAWTTTPTLTGTNFSGTAASLTAGTATNIAGGAAGTLFYNTTSGTTTTLSIGTAGQILVTNAGATAPAWATTLSANYSFTGTPTFSNTLALNTTGNAGSATNIAGGSANQIPYQTGAGATSFFSAADYGIPIYESTGIPTSLAGAAGVLQGSASANPVWTTTPTLTGTNFSGTAASLTAGLATSIAAGSANQIPYQTGAGATSFFSAADYGVLIYSSAGVPSALAGAAGVLQGSASANPAWTTTPTLTGTNFSGIPNGALSNSSVTIAGTVVSLGGSVSVATLLTDIGNFSTSSTTAGFVPGSNGVGSTYFLDGSGAWAIPAGGSAPTITAVSGAGPYYILGNTATSGSLSAADVVTSVSYNASTGALSATSFTGAGTGLTGTASSLNIGGNAATATTSTNITGGSTNQIPYQTGAGTTSFYSAANYGVQTYTSTGVPSSVAGAAGVLQGSASAIPAFTTTPTLTGTNFSGTAASLTVGNATVAVTATNVGGGSTNQIPYQTGAGATSFFGASNYGVQIYGSTGVPSSIAGAAGVLQGSASAIPAFTTTPTLTSLTLSGLTANSFLYSGTSGLLTTTSAPTNGQLLIGSTGAAPVAATLASGQGITVTNAAGSVTVGTNGDWFSWGQTGT